MPPPIPLADLLQALTPYRNQGLIVLYSNGMTHPAQARDSLFRLGFRNVYLLTDGLAGFIETCLKPPSLRPEPVPAETAQAIRAWRSHFLGAPTEAAVRDVEAGLNPEIPHNYFPQNDPQNKPRATWRQIQ